MLPQGAHCSAALADSPDSPPPPTPAQPRTTSPSPNLDARPSVDVQVLCDKADDERVIGIHMVGEGAAEIVPGYALAMQLGMTKGDLDATIGVHPTVGEDLTTLRITKRSGEDASKKGC